MDDVAVVLLQRGPAQQELLQQGAVHVKDFQGAGTRLEDHSETAKLRCSLPLEGGEEGGTTLFDFLALPL